MGVAIGTVVHSQVAALVGTLVWIFVVETLLVGLFDWLDLAAAISYLPFHALDAADGVGGGDELLSYWAVSLRRSSGSPCSAQQRTVRTLKRDIS